MEIPLRAREFVHIDLVHPALGEAAFYINWLIPTIFDLFLFLWWLALGMKSIGIYLRWRLFSFFAIILFRLFFRVWGLILLTFFTLEKCCKTNSCHICIKCCFMIVGWCAGVFVLYALIFSYFELWNSPKNLILWFEIHQKI